MKRPSPLSEYQQHDHLIVKKTVPTGKRLIVIAEASDGPMYDPVHAYSSAIAEMYFNNGPLVDRYNDIANTVSNADIFLMRINPRDYNTAYEYLKAFSFDLIYIDDFNFGHAFHEVYDFIEFAEEKERLGQLIHGFFGLKQFDLFSELDPVFAFIESLSSETVEGVVEQGKYFSVIVDQFYEQHAGAVYAALVNSLNPSTSPLNKPIKNGELSRTFTKEEILTLKQMGIVCFRESFKKGVVCATSTCAVTTEGSPHKHISNFRIVQYILQILSEELQKQIGRVHSKVLIDSLFEHAATILNHMMSENHIRQYEFVGISEPFFGQAFIDINLVPVFTTEKMKCHTQVKINR